MVRNISLLDKISLHTQAEVISSEQQPLLLPCLPLQYILLKASLQDQRSPSQALPKQQFAAAMQGFTSQTVVRHFHHSSWFVMTAYAAIAIAFTTRDLCYRLDSTHLTFRHLVKLSGHLVTQNHPLNNNPKKTH